MNVVYEDLLPFYIELFGYFIVHKSTFMRKQKWIVHTKWETSHQFLKAILAGFFPYNWSEYALWYLYAATFVILQLDRSNVSHYMENSSQNILQKKFLLCFKEERKPLGSNTQFMLTKTIWPACHIISNFCFSVYSANLNLSHSFPLMDQYCSAAWQIIRDFHCLAS